MPETPAASKLPRRERSFFRDILEVARIYQTEMMRLLAREKGHGQLRLSFQPIMMAIPTEGIRITALAASLGMSKQNCFQLLKQVENAGYIERRDDPADKRARHIYLTPRGVQLLHDAIEITGRTNAECIAILGREAFGALAAALHDTCQGLGLHPLARVGSFFPSDEQPDSFSGDLILLANHCNTALMDSTIQRGHPALRPSYGQVLMHIGQDGGRIQDIARINDISKQAVGQLVGEIEALGYIHRAPDPADGRSKILFFTPAGRALLRSSLEAADSLMEDYEALLGAPRLAQMEQALASLYRGMLPRQQARQKPAVNLVATTTHTWEPAPAQLAMYLLQVLDRQLEPGLKLFEPSTAGTGEHIASVLKAEILAQLARPLDTEAAETALAEQLGPRRMALLQQLFAEMAGRIPPHREDEGPQ